jgi:REP element-mobilizing transposase RayT
MPSDRLNELVAGVIGRAQEKYPDMRLHLFVVMSNHLHMIVSAPNQKTLSAFMGFINGQIAKEAGRLYDWPEKFWACRYADTEFQDHDKMMAHAHYLLSHGCKEGMVDRPGDWPGLNCVKALTRGKPIRGVWVDRTGMWNAGKNLGNPKQYETRYEVRLTPLPGMEEMSERERQRQWRSIVKGIEEEYKQNPVKKRFVLARNPHHRPDQVKKSCKPICHASTRELVEEYREGYESFVSAYRDAQQRFLAGEPDAIKLFPPDCYIPPFARPVFDTG